MKIIQAWKGKWRNEQMITKKLTFNSSCHPAQNSSKLHLRFPRVKEKENQVYLATLWERKENCRRKARCGRPMNSSLQKEWKRMFGIPAGDGMVAGNWKLRSAGTNSAPASLSINIFCKSGISETYMDSSRSCKASVCDTIPEKGIMTLTYWLCGEIPLKLKYVCSNQYASPKTAQNCLLISEI